MSAAGGVRLAPVIPESLDNKHPERWSPADVLKFLEINKEEYFLSDASIDAIRQNEVAGLDLLELTEEKLATSYKLPLGPAARIEKLSLELRKVKGLVAPPEAPLITSTTAESAQSGVPRSYRTSSGSTSSSFQLHAHLDNLIWEELSDTIWTDVKGFRNFFKHVEGTGDSPTVLLSLSAWLKSSPKEFEDNGKLWFTAFSESVRASVSSAGISANSRFYYGSGEAILCDAYHKAERKMDIFLQQKLPDDQHKLAITSASNPKHQFSWRDVLVVGELKYHRNQDSSKTTMTQLGGYVREVFGAQPGRRFVHAFTVCGNVARLWMFDRAGVSGSKALDISSEVGQSSFLRALLGYMTMSPQDLGYDERYKDSSGEIFLSRRDVEHPSFLDIGGKRLELLDILSWSPSIVSRGTLCWKARDDTGLLCVIKDSWRDQELMPEATYWLGAEERGVLGVPEILVAKDVEVACRESENENNIRRGFDFSSAKPTSFRVGTAGALLTSSSMQQSSTTIESDIELATSHGSRKRGASELNDHSSKRARLNKNASQLARVRNLMVLRVVGEKLENITSAVKLLEVFRDAIKCHQSLYESAGILHCDISMNNVMASGENGLRGLKGFLIDLDHAQSHEQTTAPNINLSSTTMVTGTPAFMALELLLQHSVVHTWRHDLESFLYVLIWRCIGDDAPKYLHKWRCALKTRECAQNKRHSMLHGFDELVGLFEPNFKELQPLARNLREILFYTREYCKGKSRMYIGTPPGDLARRDIYKKVLAEFDFEIDRMKQEPAAELDPAGSTPVDTNANEKQATQNQGLDHEPAKWVKVYPERLKEPDGNG